MVEPIETLPHNPHHWRGYAGRVAAILSTPLPAVLAMGWTDMCAWYDTAREIDRETWGLWRKGE